MQRLVSPELRVYTIPDREALSELVVELRLDKTLAGKRQPQATAWVQDAWTWPPGAPDGRELAAPGIGALAEASGERKARSGRGQQCDPHFQTLLLSTDSRRALT